VSKRPDEGDAPGDMEAGMTTAERRRRRRRGGLRVPSDNVPRRSNTPAQPVPPVPEDPNLAVSIAYSFSSDKSGKTMRPDTEDRSTGEIVARPDTDIIGDGPNSETVEPGMEEEDFESKTREMTAVDLEELGLTDPSQVSGEHRIRAATSPSTPPATTPATSGPSTKIIVDDAVPELPSIRRDQSQPIAVRRAGVSEPPPLPPAKAKPTDPPPRAPAAAASSTSGRAHTPSKPPPAAENPFARDEKSVEIDVDEAPRPDETPTLRRGGRPSVGRAATVALSDDDLEELLPEDSGRGRIHAPIEQHEERTMQLDAVDLEVVGAGASTPGMARAGRDESGEIVVDMVDDVDSGDVATPVPIVKQPPAAAAPVAPAAAATVPSSPPPPAASTTPPAPPPAVRRDTPQSSPQIAAPSSPPPTPGTPPPPAAQTSNPGLATGAGNGASAAPKPAPPPAPAPKKPVVARAAAVAAERATPDQGKRARRGKPWFEEIFDEDYLRTLPFLTPQATQSEAQFVIDAMSIQPGAQLLDLGCGYGRHAMELAARGFHLVGLDLSLPLLLRGADEAQRRGLSINFVHGDMRELDFDAQFDGVYCLFSTFGYFDDETNKKTASNIARALKPGGRCVLEVLNRDYVIHELPTRVWWEGDGCVVLEEVDFNYFSSRVHSNRSVVFDDGRQIEQEISVRAYSLHELGKLLHSAGFRVVEVSGSLHTRGRFFGNQSRHIIVVAEKKLPGAGDGKT
jgi:SAM-dependent methyltransferase